jgi:hypothetical protein
MKLNAAAYGPRVGILVKSLLKEAFLSSLYKKVSIEWIYIKVLVI